MESAFRRREHAAAVVALALLGGSPAAHAETPLTTVRVAQGLSSPLYVTAPPGDTSRVFIVEQRGSDNRGRIKIVKNNIPLETPFLTTDPLASGFEQGLLGLAFAPDYSTSGRFYINYTDSTGTTIIARHVVTADPDVAESVGAVVLSIPQPFANHNGGWMGFGPDGYLYVATGDGGSGGDPDDRAQNLDDLLGKVLRLDVSGSGYAIPPGNPFAGSTPGLDEIWSFGLRNPWRCSFDRDTGDMVIGDVGQGQREEVDFSAAGAGGGANFGWRCYEGTVSFSESATTPCGFCAASTCSMVLPAYEYDHSLGRCSLIGGYVYRGSDIPDLGGEYFFGDWCTGQIYSGRFQSGLLINVRERTAELAPGGGLSIGNVTSFGEDARGEMYVCDQDGDVYKIIPQSPSGVAIDASPRESVEFRTFGPLPFHSEIRLEIELGREERGSLDLFDLAGRHVRTLMRGTFPAGRSMIRWDGKLPGGADAPSGVYFVRLRTERWVRNLRVPLVR